MFGLLLIAAAPAVAMCDVTAYGAVADDGRDDTQAVQRAIDACAGQGGTVHVPGGRFDVAHLRLRSRLTLHLAPGALLSHVPDFTRYPALSWAEGHRALIGGDELEDVAITGLGAIDGNGQAVWPIAQARIDARADDPRADGERVRFGLLLKRCRNVRVRDITIRNTPMFLMGLDDCDGAVVDGVRLEAPIDSPNTDGLQIIDSRDVRVSNCAISVGDDGIVTKARAKPIERLQVTNCTIQSDDGAIKFGTRSASAVRDSQLSNIAIRQSRYGIALFMIHGGAYENIRFSGIRFEGGGRHARDYPLFVDIDDRAEGDARGRIGRIDGLTIDGLDATSRGNILIAGHPAFPIRDLTLSNLRLRISTPVAIGPGERKPFGNRKYRPVPGSPDYSTVTANLVLAEAVGVRLFNVDVPEGPRPRMAARNVRGLVIDGREGDR